jgi:hypothetical protein
LPRRQVVVCRAIPLRSGSYVTKGKSLYIKGLQCHKALWLHKNRPELKAKPSAARQAAFDSSTDSEILAQRLFPDGVLVPYAELRQQLLEYCHLDTLAMVRILEKIWEPAS